MGQKPPKPKAESEDKGAGKDESPMGRFKSLARKLANVPHKELEEQQRRYGAAKAARKK